MKLTPTQRKVLERAAKRERGNICPMPEAKAAAEQAVIDALERRGLIYWDGRAPRINAAGRAAVAPST